MQTSRMGVSKTVWANWGLYAILTKSAALLGPLNAAHQRPAAAAKVVAP